MSNVPVESELARELEQELDMSGRRSLAALCMTWLALGAVGLIVFGVVHWSGNDDASGARLWIRLFGLTVAMALPAALFVWQMRKDLDRAQVMSATTALALLLGTTVIASRLVAQKIFPDHAMWGLLDLFLLHVTACCILPWTAKESAQPFVPLLLVWAVAILIPGGKDAASGGMQLELLDRVVIAISSPIILVPGALFAHWRTERRQDRGERIRLGRQVRSIGGELSRARVVHDAMFPRPRDTGHVVFDYIYLPIAEIGGDYVHLHICPRTDRLTMTLLDVAGHGLAAALTVNRLFGELERIRAENPDAEPSTVVRLLNRYINLTMAPVNLYATGACIQLDPASGALTWVNAGHPPAFVRRPCGNVDELSGTSMLLGALEHEKYDPNQQATKLAPGDVVIAYTDGAFEARNALGRQFGLESLRETACFQPPPRNWSKFIANAVAKHHEGHADDDVLIATLTLQSRRVPARRRAAAEVTVPARATAARDA